MSGLVVVIGVGAALGLGFLFGLATVRGTTKESSTATKPIVEREEAERIEGHDSCHSDSPPEQTAEHETEHLPEGFEEIAPSEFEGLLAELGATPTEDESPLQRELALRETEIEELRARLADLVPVGERLGATEAELLESREECADLERRRAHSASRLKKLQARWKVVPEDLREAAKRIADLEERLARFKRDKRQLASKNRKAEHTLAAKLERIEELEQRVAELEHSPPPAALPRQLTDTLAMPRAGLTPTELMQLDPAAERETKSASPTMPSSQQARA